MNYTFCNLFKASILFSAIAAMTFSCEEKEEEPEKICTDPNFGETISSISGLEDGLGYVSINKVWGSFGELSFEWSNGATGAYVSGLEPGIYTVTITDEEGCTATEVFDLTIDADDEGYKVGDVGPGGGVVFYVAEDGSGFEAAPASSVFTKVPWGCSGVEISTSQGKGTGQSNTDKILAACAEEDIAARLCDELELNGFDDWYLPSADELSSLGWTIYQHEISGFPSGNYWSSSEAISTQAYAEYLPDGGGNPINKTSLANVVAVRSFE